MRRSVAAGLIGLLLAVGCTRNEAEDPASPTPSPSPTSDAEPAFDLEGVVVEASGSASFEEVPASPSPTGRRGTPTPASSPNASPSPSPAAERAAMKIERGAPGSIAVKVQRYSAGGSPCTFSENDVLVVAFTVATDFQPSDVTEKKGFPKHLVGSGVQISGRLEESDGECLLVARTVRVGESQPASPTPTRTATRRTTSPTPTAATSPTTSPSG